MSQRFFRYQVVFTLFTNLQTIWTPGKNLTFPDLLSRNVSSKDLNGHQVSHKEIPRLSVSTNQSAHKKIIISLSTAALLLMEITMFIPFFCTHLAETNAFHLKNDGIDIICTVFDSKSPGVIFNVSDSFREGKNIFNRRKWQAPPMVVEAEDHEM